MTDLGTIFLPRDAWDIAAYDTDECVAGYREYRIDDPVPGPNHSPGYRWGWTNAHQNATGAPDGYEPQRRAYIAMTRNPH